jgi:hypothetical protein
MRAIAQVKTPDYRYITIVIETTGRSEKRRKKSAWIADESTIVVGNISSTNHRLEEDSLEISEAPSSLRLV